MAPHIALHEVGAPFEAKLTLLHEKKNREPGYLELNPEGKVPTLIDGEVKFQAKAKGRIFVSVLPTAETSGSEAPAE